MPRYYVNRNAQPSGEHEVHEYDVCPKPAQQENQRDLGWHPDCHSALRKAREFYANVDGCKHCCTPCHSR